MKNQLQIFDFNQAPVRVIDQGGQPWFVAADVCQVLGLSNVTEALRGLDEDELTSELLNSDTQGRTMRLISESGLYALIFKSRKAVAKAFRKWVTSEVLPEIRRVGSYSGNGDRVQGVLEQMIVDVYEGRLSLEKAEAIAGLAHQYRNGGRRRGGVDIKGGRMSSSLDLANEEWDFAALVAALWEKDLENMGEIPLLGSEFRSRWVSREVAAVASENGLFRGDIRYGAGVAAWAGAGAAARFAQLCDRFNGNVFEGIRFEVHGKGRGRYFILRKEK